jgi:hypothetical protein
LYAMRGQFLEACDCRVMCPCWLSETADEDSCTGLIVWYIEKGEINGVDVSGRALASLSHHSGHRQSGDHHVMIFVDENSSAEQEQALFHAFSGRLGGPLAELAELTGEIAPVQWALIRYESDGRNTSVSVGNMVEVTMSSILGSTKRIATMADSALATVLGTPVEVGKSSRFFIDVDRADMAADLVGRSANRGRFVYRFYET